MGRSAVALALVSGMLVVVGGSCSRQPGHSAAGNAGPPATQAGKGRGEQILRQTADFYRRLRGFQATYRHLLRVEGPHGTQEATWTSSIAAQRPNRVAMRQRHGTQGIDLVCDGEDLYLYVPLLRRYTQAEAPPTFDELARNPLLVTLNGAGPFFLELLAADPYQAIMEGVESVTYAGEETVEGAPVHRLRFTHEQIDGELWIEAGEKPLVRRYVADLSRALQRLGHAPPGTRAIAEQTYLNWRLNARPPADAFAFQPPAGVERADDLFALDNEESSPLVGQAAPDFQLSRLEGGVFDVRNERDRGIVVLDFWASWCEPCVRELPVLAELAVRYREQGVQFFAINHGEKAEAIRAFLEDRKLRLCVLLDSQGEVADRYHVPGLPTVVVIDGKGIVQHVHVGYDRSLQTKLVEELDALLASEPLSPSPPR